MSLNSSSTSSEEYELRLNGSQMLEVCQRYDRMTMAVETSKGQIGSEKLLKYQNKCARFNKIFLTEDESSITINYLKLAPFTHLKEIYVHLCPPSVFDDLYSFRSQLEVIEFSNAGITDLLRVFQPPLALITAKNPSLLSSYNNIGSSSSSRGNGSMKDSNKNRTSTNSVSFLSSTATSLSSSSTASIAGYEELFSTLTPMVLDTAPVDLWIRENYNWHQLQQLSLINCGLARMDESMHFFPRVESLNMSHNDISQIIHLQDCSFLSVLDLSWNRIRVLSNLSLVLGNIKQLFLSNNQIQSLDGLDKLFSLVELDVSYNFIEDVTEVCHIRKLPCLENVILNGNPISKYLSNKQYRLVVFQQLIIGKDNRNDLQSSTRCVPDLDGESMTKVEALAFSSHLYKAPIDQQRDLLRGDDNVYVFPFADTDIVDIYADEYNDDDDEEEEEEGVEVVAGMDDDCDSAVTGTKYKITNPSQSTNKGRTNRNKTNGAGSKTALSPLMNDEQSYTAAALMDQFTGNTSVDHNSRMSIGNGKRGGNQAKSLMRRQAEDGSGRRPSRKQSDGTGGAMSSPRSSTLIRDDGSTSPSVNSTITDGDMNRNSNTHGSRVKTKHLPVYFTPGSKENVSGAIGRCSCGELVFRFRSSQTGNSDSARRISISGLGSARQSYIDTTVVTNTTSDISPNITVRHKPRQAMIHTSNSLDFMPPSLSGVLLTDTELSAYLTTLRVLPPHVNTVDEYTQEFGKLEPVPTDISSASKNDFSLFDMTPIAPSKSSSFFSNTPDRESPFTPFDFSITPGTNTDTSNGKVTNKSSKVAKNSSQDDVNLPKKNLRSLLADSKGTQSERKLGQQSVGQQSPTSLLESFKKEKSKKNSILSPKSNSPKTSVSGGGTASATSNGNSNGNGTPGSTGWRATAANSVHRVLLSEVTEESDEWDDGNSEGGFDPADLNRSYSVNEDVGNVDEDDDDDDEENDDDADEDDEEEEDGGTEIEKYATGLDLDLSRISTSSQSDEAKIASTLPRPRAKTAIKVGPITTTTTSSSNIGSSAESEKNGKQRSESSTIHSLFQMLSLGSEPVSSIKSVTNETVKPTVAPVSRPQSPPGVPRVSGSVFGDTFPGPSSLSTTSSATAASAAGQSVRSRTRTVSDASHGRGSVGKRPSVPRPIEYIGKKQYQSLSIIENFGLYFAEQVFSPLRMEIEGPYVLRPGLESKASEMSQRARSVSPIPAGSTMTTSAILSLPSTYFVSPPPREEHFFAAFTVTSLDLSFYILDHLKVQSDAKLDVQYELSGDFREDNPSHNRVSSTSSQPSSQPSSLASSKNPSPTSPHLSPLSRLKSNISSRFVSNGKTEDSTRRISTGQSIDNGTSTSAMLNIDRGSGSLATAVSDPRLRRHPISAQQGLEEEIQESDFIFALTDAALYIFRKECLPVGAVFRDAPVPVLYRCHPMHHLRELSIFFGLQRCMIQFSPTPAEIEGDVCDWRTDLYARYPDGSPRQNMPSTAISTSTDINAPTEVADLRYAYAYVIVTRDKSQMHPIIEHFSNSYTLARQMFTSQNNIFLAANLLIRSKDLDILNQIRHHLIGSKVICEIMHYQMCYQVWRKRSDIKVPRTIVLTPSHVLLFYEELYTQEVQITLLDKASYKNVVGVRIETASPGYITLVLRASPMMAKTRKWRLYLNNQQALSRLYDAVKSCCADAKNQI